MPLSDHQTAIDFLEQFYQFLQEQGLFADKARSYNYLNTLIANKNNSHFIAQLHTKELQAVTSNQYSLTSMLFYSLAGFDEQKIEMNAFRSYLNAVMDSLPLLSKEILNTAFNFPLILVFKHDKHTALSLAVDLLIRLRIADMKTYFDHHEAYQPMMQLWFSHVIQYLISQGVDPDKGFIGRFSILETCIKYSRLMEDDELYQLAHELLTPTRQIDNVTAAFAIANLRGYPEAFQKALLAKGADINHLSSSSLFSTPVLEPILNDAIRRKEHMRIKQLLTFGANPNKMPVLRDKLPPLRRERAHACVLTPFQLAVSLDDAVTIDMIRQHCQLNSIPIQIELDSFEKSRPVFHSLDSMYKYQGAELFIYVRNSVFGNEAIPLIKNKFGLNCFIESQNDQPNVIEAISWLYERAPYSCAARFWSPALDALKKEQQSVKAFAVYIGDTPHQYGLQQSQSQENCCTGVYVSHGNISVQTGLSIERYVYAIAHEVGHLLDVKNLGLGTISGICSNQAISFVKAMEKDFEHFDNKCYSGDDFVQIRMPIFQIKQYPNRTNQIQEFFTRVLIHIPIHYAFTHPHATEDELMSKLRHYFPETIGWYEMSYAALNHTLTRALDQTLFGHRTDSEYKIAGLAHSDSDYKMSENPVSKEPQSRALG